MAAGSLWMATAILATLAPGQDPHAHHGPAPVRVEGGWVKYHHKTAGFSLEHPADWTVSNEKVAISIHIAHPTKPAHLYVSAFRMSEGTLRDFAELKFGAQPELFTSLGPPRTLDGVGWNGLVQDAETTHGGGRTRRRVLCARHGDLYVSLALYIDANEFAAPDMDYDRLFTSLRFDADAPVPAPAQVQPQ
jgi:hypothetical protein